VLAEMQTRISLGPHAALGIAESSSAEQVRAAFLQLTKLYHPARFGRMATDVQRLANEVFLGIKGAHDHLTKLLGSSGRSAPMRPIADGTNKTPAPQITGPHPRVSVGTQPPATRARSSSSPIAMTPAGTAIRTTGQVPAQRRTTPLGIVATPPVAPINRPTPALGVAIPRTLTPAGTPKPNLNPSTIRYSGVQPTQTQTQPLPRTPHAVFDEHAELRTAMDLLSAKNWAAARQALHALAAKVPQSKQYRSLLCYTRGREAQSSGRAEEAQLEFQRALQLDPDLAIAKQALSEVQRRRW